MIHPAKTKTGFRLSVTAAEELIAGFLDKRSDGLFGKKWLKRYFVAQGHYLNYYEGRYTKTRALKGSFDLNALDTLELTGRCGIELRFGSSETCILRASTPEDSARWHSALAEFTAEGARATAVADAGRLSTHDENDRVAGAALAEPPPALPDTDWYGRKYSARSGPSAVAVAAGAAQLVTREEAVQQIEVDLRQQVLRARLKLVQQAFTRTGGRDEARNLDLAAVRRSGFDNYLTDTVSRRFRVGQAVLVSFEEKKAAALGKPQLHAPSCRACPSLPITLTHSLAFRQPRRRRPRCRPGRSRRRRGAPHRPGHRRRRRRRASRGARGRPRRSAGVGPRACL